VTAGKAPRGDVERLAEVIAAHRFHLDFTCICGAGPLNEYRGQDNLHVAEQMAPLLAQARAEAWDEGFKQGGPMHDVNYDDPDAHTRNPYRAALADPKGDDQ